MSRPRDFGDEIAERFFEKVDQAICSGGTAEIEKVLREIALAGAAAEREACAAITDTEKGVRVECTSCRLYKKPLGRSSSPETENGLCGYDCPGYALPPHPSDLWPGETRGDFGYGGFSAVIRARGGK